MLPATAIPDKIITREIGERAQLASVPLVYRRERCRMSCPNLVDVFISGQIAWVCMRCEKVWLAVCADRYCENYRRNKPAAYFEGLHTPLTTHYLFDNARPIKPLNWSARVEPESVPENWRQQYLSATVRPATRFLHSSPIHGACGWGKRRQDALLAIEGDDVWLFVQD